jgi:hypothetical protein
MNMTTPTKPFSKILLRLIGSIALTAIAYYGYQFGDSHQGALGLLIRILSAAVCFVGLVAFYRAIMELINRRRSSESRFDQ